MELVDKTKQVLFLERILFHFGIRKKQVRHVSSARLSPDAWDLTLESCCLLGHCLQQMTIATGQVMFLGQSSLDPNVYKLYKLLSQVRMAEA